MRLLVVLMILLAGCAGLKETPNETPDSAEDAEPEKPVRRNLSLDFQDCDLLRMFANVDRDKTAAAVPDGYELYPPFQGVPEPHETATFHVWRCGDVAINETSAGPVHLAMTSVYIIPDRDESSGLASDLFGFDFFADNPAFLEAMTGMGWNFTPAEISVDDSPAGYTFQVVADGVHWAGAYLQPAARTEEIVPDLIGNTWTGRWHTMVEAGHAYTEETGVPESALGGLPVYSLVEMNLQGGVLPTLMYSERNVLNAMGWQMDLDLRTVEGRVWE